MFKRVLFRTAAVVAVLALGGSAKADFVIDNFTTPVASTGFVTVASLGTATRTDSLPNLGAPTRTLTITETARSTNAAESRYQVGDGTLTLSTVNSTANINAQYVYGAAQNLSAGGTSVQFTFLTADFGVPYSIRLGDGANTSTQSGTTTTGAGVYSFSTGSFAGINLSAITSIVLSLNRNLQTGGGDVVSADFSLSDVRVLTPTVNPPAVPAPPAAVLLLAALPALGLARVRRLLPV